MTSVIAFHAGVPAASGGFVGVDVFFVISGFLIIGHIRQALAAGTFTFGAFYARRALRILPTYLIVMLAVVAATPAFLLFQEELDLFKVELLWASAMVVNYLFLGQMGYFDQAAETKPLLHLWSLAVEEQFYLLAPLLLFLAARLLGSSRAPRFGRVLVAGLGWVLVLGSLLGAPL